MLSPLFPVIIVYASIIWTPCNQWLLRFSLFSWCTSYYAFLSIVVPQSFLLFFFTLCTSTSSPWFSVCPIVCRIIFSRVSIMVRFSFTVCTTSSFDLLPVQFVLQHHVSRASNISRSLFFFLLFIVRVSHPYNTTTPDVRFYQHFLSTRVYIFWCW